jgi:gamma-glutamyltranspeptidase/glutathione hydrolase
MRFAHRALLVLVAFLPACSSPKLPLHAASGTRGVVASVHPLATQAGINAYNHGGNAVDAAIAAAVTLGVVDSHNSGIGGGCFVLIRKPDGQILCIDGREMAPAAATRDMFLREGKPIPAASTTGPLAIGIPGSVAAYDYALQHAGHLKLKDIFNPAADLADRGFELDAHYVKKIASVSKDLAKFPASRSIFLDESGKPLEPGHVLKQPDLAATYRAIARDGPDFFYRGPFAAAVDGWMKQNHGLVTAADFANYQIRLREPLVTTYRGYTLIGFPPPSSGGVHVAQILNILENFDLAALNRQNPALRYHVVAEAMKLAFADRAYWLGDPDFTKVPRGLVDKQYAKTLASRIDLHRAIKVDTHGDPPAADANVFEKHTTHITAADAAGNFVAITATVNTTYGSKVVIPGTGVVMNDQMDDFSIQPGVPNAFGLVGADGNSVAPGKRPLSSMSPTIVLKNNQPFLTLGAAGGPTIINQVLQILVNHLDLGMPLPDAVAAPRIHHQWRPNLLYVEPNIDGAIVTQLKQMGHDVKPREAIGVSQASIRLASGAFISVHDPRAPGKAAGVNR